MNKAIKIVLLFQKPDWDDYRLPYIFFRNNCMVRNNFNFNWINKMKDEYIIVNKTTLEKRIEELESKEPDWFKRTFEDNFKINFLKEVLFQSTPLTPEIEKAWKHCLTSEEFVDYISNLKLDI